MIAHILTENALTLFSDGHIFTLDNTNRSFGRAVEAVRSGDLEQALKIMCPATILIEGTAEHPEFRVADGVVTYHGQPLKGYAISKLLELCSEQFPIEALVNFIVRVQDNPSNRAVEDLYRFLEYGELPLLPDGRFIAYKKIQEDWTDCRTGTLTNTVGAVVEMPRNQVDDNPNNTCSHGLHVCSMEYLSSFGGARCVACAVDPADVVSIPIDYTNTKMRVCRYEVLAEIPQPQTQNPWNRPVVDEYEPDEEDYEEEEEEEALAE